MESNNFDRFEAVRNDTVSQSEGHFGQENNFFLFNSAPSIKLNSEPTRRINDYDYNLLNENAYKDIKDDAFRLEYRISKRENEIKELTGQLAIANEIHDTELAEKISDRLITIKDEYENLLDSYNNKSLSAKFSGQISSVFGRKLKSVINNVQMFLANLFIKANKNLPKNIGSLLEVKQSLNKLENINKSVDELIKLNTPSEERFDKYKQLSKYIIKANSIQSDLYKQLKK